MKKLMYGLAAGAIAAAMCVSFAACGGTSAKDMKGEEVTAEEWLAAFSDDNFTNFKLVSTTNAKGKYEEESGDLVDTTQVYEQTVIKADDTEYMKVSITVTGSRELAEQVSDQSHEEYDVISEGKTTQYTFYDGEWRKSEENYEYHIALGAVEESILVYRTAYSAFEYSKEKGGYIVKTGDDPLIQGIMEEFGNVVLKFKNKKLAALYYEADEGEGDEAYHYVAEITVTYGGQKLTLPTVTE